jgi:hypothetical protein
MSQKSHDGRSLKNAGVPAINIGDDGAGGQSSAVLAGGVTHESSALKALVARHPFTLKQTLAGGGPHYRSMGRDAAKRPPDEESDGNLAADPVRDPVAATVSIQVDGRAAPAPAATAMPNIRAALPGFALPPMQPTPDLQVLFADDFSFPLSTAKWDYNHFDSGGSFYGRTQQRQSLPVDSNGVLHLQLDTFNPTGPGVSFLGSEAVSVPTFTTASGGTSFEITARIVSPVPGFVGGLFGFNLVDPVTGIHNELDYELLSNDAAAGRNRVVTNVYSNDPPGPGHPLFVPASDLTAFHSYRMEWFPDRVRWFVDGQFVREETVFIPQGALALRLNIWVPDANWADAYSASLQPAASEAANASYYIDVDAVRVSQLAPVQAAATGGRFVFSSSLGPIVLGINDGVRPVFPTPQAGAYNIEVFTNSTVAAVVGVPSPDSGWNTTAANPGGTIESGFLTGTNLRLGAGNFLIVDSVTGAATQSPARITLGQGAQTVVGARFDTLVAGDFSGQILSALAGNQRVIGGAGNVSIWGGANDSIVGGTGADQQIVVTGNATTVVAGLAGAATIALAAFDTVLSLPGSTQNVIVAAGQNNLVDLTGNAGQLNAVIGASGDTIVAGAGVTNIEGAAGGMLVMVGAGGTTNLSGGASPVAGNTVLGGAGNFNFNPSAVAGKGDLIDLSGSSGAAQVNAFAARGVQIAAPDTILAGNGAGSVFGGAGDRIGTGNGSVVGGTHQWVHADGTAGAAVGFGSNDTVASTTYDTVAGTATRGTVAGTSSAQVTVGGFTTATDFIFYQNESAATTDAIIATAQATDVGGTPSTLVTLPDGTAMTLVGITQAQLTPALFKP